ncbi:fimbrial biogenesis chaperone [Algoriphagus mannitolivorans]|uniref:hypothetical protein n=1 Tax=Algoriphagus mannitolivorans TaxID=226504 RepID=UPI00041533D1|nr:hypothetical protein [Algoriphagus mannitolivorans]
MKKQLITLLLSFFLFGICNVQAQISLAPTTVFIDQNGVGTLFVTNPGNVPQEISIGFEFGYPGNDELGNLKMVYGDSVRALQNGFGDRVRAFPRTFILAPQQQQTIRLQVRPDRSASAGTYFTRIKITSNPQTPDIEQTNTDEVTTQVNFQFDQIIAAFQKVGQTSTGLEIGEVKILLNENKFRAIPEFKVTGNSPFIGSVTASVKNSQGEVIKEIQQTVALYYSGLRAVEIELTPDQVATASQIELKYETKRADIPSGDLVQCAPIIKTVPLK